MRVADALVLFVSLFACLLFFNCAILLANEVALTRRAFSVAAASTWNSQPADIRPCEKNSHFQTPLENPSVQTQSSCAATSASVSSSL